MRAKRLKALQHPNTARLYLGQIWAVSSPAAQKNFTKLMDGKGGDTPWSYFSDGTWIYWVGENSELSQRFQSKTYPLYAIVIGVDSLATFKKFNPKAELFNFFDREAVHIRMKDHGYDIIAVESLIRNN
jgi:hypothetical protein